MAKTVTAKQLQAIEPYKWQPGVSPNPAGRPKGSRSKLNEQVLKFLYADFNEHGEDVIREVRKRKPEMYLAAVVSLLPKQQQKIESPFIDLTDEELQLLESFLTASRAKLVQQIEPEPAKSQKRDQIMREAVDILDRKEPIDPLARTRSNGKDGETE